MNYSRICLLHRQRAKLDGEIKISKEEYQLACELETKGLADDTLKENIMAQLMYKYDYIPVNLVYTRHPITHLCKKYGGLNAFCELLGVTDTELGELYLKYKYPIYKANKLTEKLHSVLSEQDFCNYVYSVVYEEYNDMKEPFSGYKITIPKRFYKWAQERNAHLGKKAKANMKAYNLEVVSPRVIAEYIQENMSEYSIMYKEYKITLANFMEKSYGVRPKYIANIKQAMSDGLKPKYRSVYKACEDFGLSHNTLYSLYTTCSLEPLGKYDHFIKEAGIEPLDFFYTCLLNSVDRIVRE